ncbi:hypothetical protein [Paenibacillus sp. GP183]|uniref:hypothetical protein n=1 Tax=Paenibacillus sp. GP183 TaxID=1882751 RepID=UPI000896681C|nr:hypothetical protein [Paenibacillus sp. GP183]SED18079.1 hypothetical protein SAMN05443246_5976 [Paenibacillus sp. GP183]
MSIFNPSLIPELEIRENDLSQDPKLVNWRNTFYETDVVPLTTPEVLQKGYVIFPVYRREDFFPYIGQKYCTYLVEAHGLGLVTIIREFGLKDLNPNNEQYVKPTSVHRKIFHFAYNEAEGCYEQIKKDAFKERLAKRDEQLNTVACIKVNRNFRDFYSSFWMNRIEYENKMNLGSVATTNQNYSRYFQYSYDQMNETVRSYLQFLADFGFITHAVLNPNLELISNLLSSYTAAKNYLDQFPPGEVFDSDRAYHAGNKVVNAMLAAAKLYNPGFWIDVKNEKAIPNLGELYVSRLQSPTHRDHESKQQRIQSAIEKGKQQKGQSMPFVSM